MLNVFNRSFFKKGYRSSGQSFPFLRNKLCELIGIPLLDHIIVGGDNRAFFSFKEKGMIDNPRITLSTDYRNLDIKSPLVAEQGKAR